MIRRIIVLFAMIAVAVTTIFGQMVKPVSWNVKLQETDGNHGKIVATASVEAGWHMYSNEVDPEIGPMPLQIEVGSISGMELDGPLVASHAPHKEYDNMFGANLSWWSGNVTLTQKVVFTSAHYSIEGAFRYSACNNENCIPPTREAFEFSGVSAAVSVSRDAAPTDTVDVIAAVSPTAAMTSMKMAAGRDRIVQDSDLWAPVDVVDGDAATESGSSAGLMYIFIACFIGGLVALLTPCVWPMIPLTVSFFLKKGRQRAVADALIYGVSIVVIYVALGLIISATLGASALNAMATSAVANIIFFVLLVVFAISFFGAFDITLPAKWSNSMDATAERTTGLLSIFFMAFTLTLVSFSCTGPIIGTLLVEAASTGDKLGPAIGMLGFSLGLAIPFCLFGMFPSWLKSVPRSGGWMNTVKVVLGFVELALSLKFLSVADLAYGWHILDREVFLCLWIVIFALLGFYLLGAYTFAHYGDALKGIGVGRFSLALVSLAFAMYLVPGLWGAPLKGVSAFVPPLYTQDFNLYGNTLHEYSDYDEGMRAAAREGRPVLVDFSGYGCVNCRKMEAAVLDNQDIHTLIADNFVVIKLMVDEKRLLPAPEEVMEDGRKTTLYSYGDRWSYLQRYKFGANAQPYYVVLSLDGRMLSGPYSYDENIDRFSRFLQRGLEAFSK